MLNLRVTFRLNVLNMTTKPQVSRKLSEDPHTDQARKHRLCAFGSRF